MRRGYSLALNPSIALCRSSSPAGAALPTWRSLACARCRLGLRALSRERRSGCDARDLRWALPREGDGLPGNRRGSAQEVIRLAPAIVGHARRRHRRRDVRGLRLAQPSKQVAPAPGTCRGQAHRTMIGLAQPPLVRGARRAQLAHGAGFARREEDLGLLAAQQPSLAHVAGYVRLGGDDRPGCHSLGRVACPDQRRLAVGVMHAWSRARRWPARLPSARDGRGPPRNVGTQACSRPGPP